MRLSTASLPVQRTARATEPLTVTRFSSELADKIADIRDHVRSTSPAFQEFQEVTRQLINLQPAGPIEVLNQRFFQFWEG